MTETTPHLALPLLAAGQAQKHVTHNEALMALDALAQLAVLSASTVTPPATPGEGDRYIVPEGAGGTWAGHAQELAIRRDGAWLFATPAAGWRAEVLDESGQRRFDGSRWSAATSLEALGIGAAPDPVNRLTVAAEATLLSHAGGSHRLAINRAGTGDTASLIFQTGYAGTVEIGTAGDGDFRLKSWSGSAWETRLFVDSAEGRVGIGTEAPSAALHVAGAIRPGSATVAELPSAAEAGAGALIYCSDAAGGAIPAFSDGSAWRRCDTRAVVT